MSKKLQRAGSLLLRHVDTTADVGSHAALRTRVVQAIVRPSRPPSGRLLALVLVPAALSILLLVFAIWKTASPSPITFAVGTATSPGLVGDYLVPAGGAPLTLRFSEGSAVTFSPDARGRVSSASAHGAAILLEAGQARCDIAHRPGASWVVQAGPYSVEVKGTGFDITWDTTTSVLELQMRQGLVVLRGPGVESGLELRDTQRFVSRTHVRAEAPTASTVASELAEVAVSGPDAAVEWSTERLAPASTAAAAAAEPSAQPSAAPSAAPAPAVSWSELARRGDYPSILAEAEARGIDGVLSSGSDAELAALADAARFVGRSALAARVLQATRARFPGTGRAASAAYVLGRMADDGGNSAAALGWYERYLAEAPGGPLAPEALGRKMLLLRRSGKAAAACEAAEDYLRRFPKGPYSGVAREMTSQ
jgi:TolA-binding protein